MDSVQGWAKITFPGCVNMKGNNCGFLPATGAKKAIVSHHIHTTWEGFFSAALYSFLTFWKFTESAFQMSHPPLNS